MCSACVRDCVYLVCLYLLSCLSAFSLPLPLSLSACANAASLRGHTFVCVACLWFSRFRGHFCSAGSKHCCGAIYRRIASTLGGCCLPTLCCCCCCCSRYVVLHNNCSNVCDVGDRQFFVSTLARFVPLMTIIRLEFVLKVLDCMHMHTHTLTHAHTAPSPFSDKFPCACARVHSTLPDDVDTPLRWLAQGAQEEFRLLEGTMVGVLSEMMHSQVLS